MNPVGQAAYPLDAKKGMSKKMIDMVHRLP
jgi:hypothetical protein